MSGMTMIDAERQRQIEVEEWSADHDDEIHWDGSMYRAAQCYLEADGPDAVEPETWPWESAWWKPKERLRNLVRGGALLLAERDRILRWLARAPETCGHRVRNNARDRVNDIERQMQEAAEAIDLLGTTAV
jgi:hypothetical protein